jgi:integrase
MELVGAVGKSADPKRRKSPFYYSYRDRNKIQHRLWYRTERAAKAEQLRISNEIGTGVHTPKHQSITVADACDMWLQECAENNLAPGTMRGYRGHVKRYVIPMLGEYKLSELKMSHIKQFANAIRTETTPTNARRLVYTIRSILKTAQENIMPPTPEEINEMLAAARPHFRPMLITAVRTGMRWGELRALTWPCIDFERMEITVKATADQLGNIRPVKTKTGFRLIPVSPMLAQVLREWKMVCPKRDGLSHLKTYEAKALQIEQLIRAGLTQREIAAKLHVAQHSVVGVRNLMREGTEVTTAGTVLGRYLVKSGRRISVAWLNSITPTGELHYVFPLRDGGLRSHHSVTWELRDVQKRIGLLGEAGDKREGKAKHVPHRTRHMFATYGIREGWPIKVLQGYLGHAKITETMDTYGHLLADPEGDQARLAKSDKLFLTTVKKASGNKIG